MCVSRVVRQCLQRWTAAILGAILAPILASRCAPPPVGCFGDLQLRVTPASGRLAVGERLSATATAYGCGGRTPVTGATFTWAAQDTTVVRVDAGSGVITARARGTTAVEARLAPREAAAVPLTVTVE